jgi:short subunit dehydrogenase-like uncharacterized protein
MGRWLIYGSSGYTGTLVAEHAVSRGHRPVLAGRSRDKVEPLANRLGLECAVFSLDDAESAARALAGCDLVFHAAGPFVFTSDPMIRSCLAAAVNYVDVTGEIPVFENTFQHDAAARERGICLMSGVGFDVVPTDCMARYVADRLPGATRLEIAFASSGGASAGTIKSALEHVPKGNFVRRGGALTPVPTAHEIRMVRFYDKERTVVSIPWGDLSTAYRSTGIGDITTYMAQSENAAKIMRATGGVMRRVLGVDAVRSFAQDLVAKRVRGPDETARRAGRSHVWVRASKEGGEAREAWLETLGGYDFTAAAGVRAVERLLEKRPKGALTPSTAFGHDFVLEIEETTRYDALP